MQSSNEIWPVYAISQNNFFIKKYYEKCDLETSSRPFDSTSKTVKNVFYFIEKTFFVLEIFVIFPLPVHTFQIQKNKWKWNNL